MNFRRFFFVDTRFKCVTLDLHFICIFKRLLHKFATRKGLTNVFIFNFRPSYRYIKEDLEFSAKGMKGSTIEVDKLEEAMLA